LEALHRALVGRTPRAFKQGDECPGTGYSWSYLAFGTGHLFPIWKPYVGFGGSYPQGIANRDIKLENMLLDGCSARPLLKLCDFGYSKDEFLDSRPTSLSGTPHYMVRPVSVAHREPECQWPITSQDVSGSSRARMSRVCTGIRSCIQQWCFARGSFSHCGVPSAFC
jgi:hypothetical protein